ncbi:MAG: N-acetylmuramoyl-L-alanine amidase [Lachnospiraceae bacterium]|nr:N-acetylmuramoyl-L-alanine amidase [Lachnospiraceae bacterium]
MTSEFWLLSRKNVETAMQKKRRRRGKTARQRQIENRRRLLRTILAVAGIVVVILIAKRCLGEKGESRAMADGDTPGQPDLDVQLLTVNEFSRPGIPLDHVNGIVVHYVANPGSSAEANRDYFENLQNTQTTKASSHFIVGLDGEIIQCVPTAEIAYASNERNGDTISIETCHPDETGAYNEATYQSLVNLTAWLCKKFGLTSEQVIRHYDITGKICPKYFVENEGAWADFKKDVDNRIENL